MTSKNRPRPWRPYATTFSIQRFFCQHPGARHHRYIPQSRVFTGKSPIWSMVWPPWIRIFQACVMDAKSARYWTRRDWTLRADRKLWNGLTSLGLEHRQAMTEVRISKSTLTPKGWSKTGKNRNTRDYTMTLALKLSQEGKWTRCCYSQNRIVWGGTTVWTCRHNHYWHLVL